MNNKQHSLNANRPILLTGASGYVGARLLRALEQQALQVRCLARRPEMLIGRIGARTEIVAGDVLDPDSLDRALQNVDTAFCLVHSMGSVILHDLVESRRLRVPNGSDHSSDVQHCQDACAISTGANYRIGLMR